MDHAFSVYILTDKGHSTLYIGVTNDLRTRLWQHRNPDRASFTQRYHCGLLIHLESFPDIAQAIAREKQLKGWRRAKKIALIQAKNPRWIDLSQDWPSSAPDENVDPPHSSAVVSGHPHITFSD